MDINFIKEYIKGRLHELSSLDGAVIVGISLGVLILPVVKWLAWQDLSMDYRILKSTVNIELTDSAISQLLERTEDKGVSEIRLGITGGGCGGYEYIFDYNTTNDPSDQVLDFGKFTIHIDTLSLLSQ